MRVTALAVVLAIATTYAQTPTQTPPKPVFTSGVEVARMDVRVSDKNGKPIQDLRADEVQVLENGVARPILLFQHVGDASRTRREATERTVASEVSTNQGAPRGQLYLLLFDQQHITPGAEQKVRLAAERFIKEKVQPQDRVAVYGVPLPGPSLPFTANTRAALEQLQHLRGGGQKVFSGTIGEMTVQEAYEILRGNEAVLTRFMTLGDEGTTSRAASAADALRRSTDSPDVMKRIIKENAQTIVTQADGDNRRFLQITSTILRGLRTTDGRKTIILFSEGFYGDNVHSELRDVAAAAAETYGVVYAFDLNARLDQTGDEARGADTANEILNRTEPIGSLAAETNGALVPDALNRIDKALGALGAPNSDYYIVGFAPAQDALSDRGTYRRVDIRVTRPGAVVNTRTGYSVGAAAKSDVPATSVRRQNIDAALTAPFGHQGLRVEYTTYQSHGDAPGTERIALSLEAELPLASADQTQADVVFVVRDSRTGRVAASGSGVIALPTAVTPGFATGRGQYRVQFSVPPGEYLMRCVVREPGGVLGSADRQFAARSLSGPDVAPSDLVLGTPGRNLPVRASAWTAKPLSGAVRVYGRSADRLQQISGRLELIPLGGSNAAVGVAAVAADTRDVDGQLLRDLLFDVPLTNLPAGEYTARAQIRSGSDVVAELKRQVTVFIGEPPAQPDAPDAPDAPGAPSRAASLAAEGVVAQKLLARSSASQDLALQLAATGVSQLKQAKYSEAAVSLDMAFSQLPKDASIAFMLGWAQRGAGAPVAAITAFRNAALLDPAMIPAHLALAETYLELKQAALAIQALEAGLAAQPGSLELKRMLESLKK